MGIRLTNFYDLQMARYQIVIPDEVASDDFLNPIASLFGNKKIDLFYYLISFIVGYFFIYKSMKIEKPSN